MDKDDPFSIFKEDIGAPYLSKEVPASSIEKYKGILPAKLLEYWHTEGWSGYSNGLIWTVNPDDYSSILEHWIEGTALSDKDGLYVFARTAFGKLYVWSKSVGDYIVITPYYNNIFAPQLQYIGQTDESDLNIEMFFLNANKEDFDIENDDGEYLFDSLLEKLGPLKEEELYGFEPALILGGTETADNLKKLDLIVHLSILRNFSEPEVYG
ncbi:GAD-like domain-containing protein [Kangiella sp. HZ709]|uniref:GAD-like domain-containing protein n=1 Tax=Kangiella sp. HZ709 TaxID=2666328 RepID=UPI0012AEF291|nr:GAD-like domain-containing protein [Kangiella sp. HZ709]MRX26865.1 DUF1851 domain-containing protein [Kangiella sp. HZ709]